MWKCVFVWVPPKSAGVETGGDAANWRKMRALSLVAYFCQKINTEVVVLQTICALFEEKNMTVLICIFHEKHGIFKPF